MSRFTDAELAAMDAAAERREASAAYRSAHPEDSLLTGKCCGFTLLTLPHGVLLCAICGKTFETTEMEAK